MAKYNKVIVQEITDLIEEGYLSICEICKRVGISRKMYYEWKAEKPEFKDAVEEASEAFYEKLRHKSRKTMMYKMGGYKQVETKKIYIAVDDDSSDMMLKQHIVKERYFVADVSNWSGNSDIENDFGSDNPAYLKNCKK